LFVIVNTFRNVLVKKGLSFILTNLLDGVFQQNMNFVSHDSNRKAYISLIMSYDTKYVSYDTNLAFSVNRPYTFRIVHRV
jgi:hypothetical protein